MEQAPRMVQLGTDLRAGVWKYFGGLVMDEKDGAHLISIGRLSFLVTFSVMLWHWVAYRGQSPVVPLQDGILEAFYALLAYVASGKVAQAIQARRDTTSRASPPEGDSGPCA